MLRLEPAPGALLLVSRLARARVLVVLSVALLGAGLLALGRAPALGWAAVAAAAAVVLLGSRTVRARLGGGRVRVVPALPLERAVERPLHEFGAVEVETLDQAKARRAEEVARRYAQASGAPMPPWLKRAPSPGINDGLRRLVLVPRAGEAGPLPVTAWLAPEEDLEPARRELGAALGLPPA